MRTGTAFHGCALKRGLSRSVRVIGSLGPESVRERRALQNRPGLVRAWGARVEEEHFKIVQDLSKLICHGLNPIETDLPRNEPYQN